MSGHQQQTTKNHRASHAQIAVGNQPAEHRHGINQSRIAAEHAEAGFITKQVIFGEVEK